MVFKKVLDVQEKIKAEKEKLKNIDYWTSFLQTASMQYKHTFNDQIAIHEAAPNSIACADARIWQKNDCTFIDTPEAILTEKDGKLHRLFDISQVQGDFTETYWIWKIDDDELNINYSDIVNRKLCDKYNIYNETLEETIYELSLSKTAQRINANGDMYNIVSESAAYMVIHRCCPDSSELSPEKVKTALTNIPIDEIGQAVMTVARDLFSEIEGIVKAERTAEIDRRNLDEYNRGINDKGNEMHLQSGEQTVLSDNQNNNGKNLHTGRGELPLLSDIQQENRSEQDNVSGTSELSKSNEKNGETQSRDSILKNDSDKLLPISEKTEDILKCTLGSSESLFLNNFLNDMMSDEPVSFALANKVLEYLDDKQHQEREIKELNVGWYKKTDFNISAVVNGEEFNYEGRYDIGDGKGTGGGSLIEHIRQFNESIIESEHYPYNKAERKKISQKVLDIFIPFLEKNSVLTKREQEIFDNFVMDIPIRTISYVNMRKFAKENGIPFSERYHNGIDDESDIFTYDSSMSIEDFRKVQQLNTLSEITEGANTYALLDEITDFANKNNIDKQLIIDLHELYNSDEILSPESIQNAISDLHSEQLELEKLTDKINEFVVQTYGKYKENQFAIGESVEKEDNSPTANENVSQEDSEQLLYPVIKPELAADEWTAITTEFFSYETAWHDVEQKISEIAESYRKGEDITEKLGKYFNINNSKNHDIEKFSDKLIITHKENGFSKEYTWSEIGIIQLQMLKDRFKEDTLDSIRWYPETADKYNALIERMEKEDYPERNSLLTNETSNIQSDILTKDCYDLDNYTFSVNGIYNIPLILNDQQRKRFEKIGLILPDDQRLIYFSTNGKSWNSFQIRDGNSWNSVDMNVILSKTERADLKPIITEIIERNSDEQVLKISSESPENNSPLANENTNIDTNKLLTETIMHGSGLQDGKFRIDEFYRENTPSTKEFASFLKKEYGIGGCSGTGNIIMISYGNNGLEIKYNENNEQKITLFNWSQVAKKTAEIIDNGNYITDKDIADRIKYAEYILKNEKEDGSHRREYAEKILKQCNVPIPESSIKNIPVGMTAVDADMAIGMIENGFTVIDRNGDILSENSVIENAMEYLVSTSDFEYQTAINTVALAINDISSRFEYIEAMLGEPYILDLMRFSDSHDWNFDIEKNVYENTVKLLLDGNTEPIENYLNCAVKELANLDDYETEYKTVLATIEHLSDYSQKYISTDIQEELIEKVEIDSLPTENQFANGESEKINEDTVDFHIDTDNIEIGGEKAKFRANIAAIETLKIIDAQHRNATPKEQEIMSKYTGWGGLQNAFDSRKSEWSNEYSELRELLTDEEYNSAKASVLDAFYTPPFIIEGIYNALNNMGFKNGNILEPSCGVGNFLGKMPENMYQNSHVFATEKDSISGRIAKLLYPNADISVCGFEEKDFDDNSFDAAVGNIPFGSFKISDKRYNKNNFMIHDYFFAKTLDKVRPGGVIAFVTSKGTLDKANPEVRRYIAQRAELIGAIRLPNNAFKSYAGTEVTSDIIFLQKREEKTNVLPDWIYTDLDSNGFSMNSYFTEHPDMILGKTVEGNKLYGRKGSMVVSFENANLKNLLSTAIMKIKAEYKEAESIPKEKSKDKSKTIITANPDVRNYSYTEIDGEIYFRTDSIMTKQDLGAKKYERMSGMIKISQFVHKLLDMQLEGYSEASIQSMRDELNRIYNEFTAKNGYLNDRSNSAIFADDISAPLLLSLEKIKDGKLVGKAAIFERTTLKPPEKITHADTASDALIVSISEKACVDMPFMEQLTGKSEQEIFSELKGVIFLNPLYNPENITEPKYFTADEYLSGNIRNKLDIAKNAEKLSPDFSINVSALEKAMPEPLEAGEITAQLGSAWIDTKYIEQFIREELKIKDIYPKIIVNHNSYTASWHIENKSELSYNNKIKTTEEYGTTRKSALEIIQDCLNQRDVTVYDTVYNSDKNKEERVINHDETLLARQKQKILEQDFKDWIFSDPDRRNALVEKYNILYNSTRQREYNGSHLTFSGMNTEITLRKHQKDAVAHALYGGNTLFAHKVGAGKSFEMIAAAMEGKRLGLHNKSLIVVPNHMTRQLANDFLELYPNANILVAEEKDFAKNNRQKLCAKIATGEFDAVIIGHSQLIKIPVSKEREEKFIDNEITEITNQIANIKATNGDNFTIKDMERVKKSLETRLDKLINSTVKDNVVTFEELGVDKLIIDEADMFKNLYINTKMRNLSGISTNENVQKTQDLYMKCQYLNEITNGKGIIFATGTPISNSISEVYIMQKYLNPKGLEEAGISHFDAWAANFAQKVTKLEFAPSGNGFVQKTRLAKFNNIPELMTMFKEFTDIKMAEDLNLPEPECERHTIAVEATPVQKKLMQNLGERADKIHKKMVSPDIDNMLNITTDGTKIGLDQRLINPDLPDDPNSKVNACINNVFEIYSKTSEKRLTQAIFCDYSTPKYDGSFSIYEDIKSKLIEKGVPENEIAFIHDCKNNKQKEALFDKVRSGDVRIILGSTQKMGAGTNIQDKLFALHHLDPTWKPRDMEQRLGRMKRQGNENKVVHEYIYVTKDTFDANRFQTLETKQGYISQIMTNHNPLRSCEDISSPEEISFAEVKAACVGNPLIKEKMELDIDISQLRSLKSSYLKSHYRLEDTIRKLPEIIAENSKLYNNALKDMEIASMYPPKFNDDGSAVFQGIIINGTKYTDKAQAGEALLSFAGKALIQNNYNSIEIGEYRGFKLSALFDELSKEIKLDIIGNNSYRITFGSSELGNLTRIENAINHIPDRAEEYMSEIKSMENQLAEAKVEYAKPFGQEQELQDKLKRLEVVEQELNKQNDDVLLDDKNNNDLEEKNNIQQEQQREQSQNTHRNDDIVSL